MGRVDAKKLSGEVAERHGQVGHTVGNGERRGRRLAFGCRCRAREVRCSVGAKRNKRHLAPRQIHRAQHGAAQDQRVGVQQQYRAQVTIAVLHFHLVRAKAACCQEQHAGGVTEGDLPTEPLRRRFDYDINASAQHRSAHQVGHAPGRAADNALL